MTPYTTKAGDMLDALCFAQYNGQQEGAVEAVIDANPTLSLQGEVLPAGFVINFPDVVPSPQSASVITRFWE